MALVLVDVGIVSCVLLEGELDDDLSVSQVLTVHALEGRVGRLEGVVADKAKALGFAGVFLSHDFRLLNEGSKGPESVVQQMLIDVQGIEIANEQIGPDVLGP